MLLSGVRKWRTVHHWFYVAFSLENPSILAELIAGPPPGCAENGGTAFSVAAGTPELLDAWTRMLGLMARPDAHTRNA